MDSSPYLESPYFHHKQKGCQIIRKAFATPDPRQSLQGFYCMTHRVDLCGKDFLEWHHGLTEQERQRKVPPRTNTINEGV